MLKNLRKNNQGLILVTVIILTIVLTIITISLFSIKMTQVRSGRDVLDSVVAEELSKGLFYKYHQSQISGVPMANGTEEIGGKTYTYTLTDLGSASTPNDTDRIDVSIDYPTY